MMDIITENGDSYHKAKYGRIGERPQPSAEEMDTQREKNMAYEYLCHLEETKMWIEACIGESLPDVSNLEESFRSGVYLAKLANFISPESVPIRRIYDIDCSYYQHKGLHFKHTDNINLFLKAMDHVKFPSIFYPETTDVYDKKNIPRLVYCLHVLSLFLFKLGKAPQIRDLYGKLTFTEEQINAMRIELEKYNIKMPAFSKIGGVLASQLPVDEASLHAAVIAINKAIDSNSSISTFVALSNPNAHLQNVEEKNAELYLVLLLEAKQTKTYAAANKSLDPDYLPDVYDELLTQAEIQGLIQQSNCQQIVLDIRNALIENDFNNLLISLKSPTLFLKNIMDSNISFYSQRLNKHLTDDQFTKNQLQKLINESNEEALVFRKRNEFVENINDALANNSKDTFLKAMVNYNEMKNINDGIVGHFYFSELQKVRSEKTCNLEYQEIRDSLRILKAIANINLAVDSKNESDLYNCMTCPDSQLERMAVDCFDSYLTELRKSKNSEYLSHFDIQNIIDNVNSRLSKKSQKIEAVKRVNSAIEAGVPAGTLSALQFCQHMNTQLNKIDPKLAVHYQRLLFLAKHAKTEALNDPEANLWYDEIVNAIHLANDQADELLKLSEAITEVNVAVSEKNVSSLLIRLNSSNLGIKTIPSECAKKCLDMLEKERIESIAKANRGEIGSGWTMVKNKLDFKMYFNVYTGECLWERRKNVLKDRKILSLDQISKCVDNVLSQYDRHLMFEANINRIILLQSQFRKFISMRNYKLLKATVKIQAWWKFITQRRSYVNRLKYFDQSEDHVIYLQSIIRSYLIRKTYKAKLDFFKKHEKSVIKIQSFVRAFLAQNDYRLLQNLKNPPFSVVRKFVHLLEQSHMDYAEEIELQQLRQQLVTDIRANQAIENDIDQMDIKIALLIKNRTTLQDVVTHHHKLKNHQNKNEEPKGITQLNKNSKNRLEAYQHLFYLLQTQPTYLARLVFELPQTTSSKLLESSVLTLFNYGANSREEYLLLKLYETALKEEINSKVDVMSEIITGNPLVIKMIVQFNREARGQEALENLLAPLVTSILDEINLDINTSPVEIYKAWVNETETVTGRPTELPYDVETSVAMQYEYVSNQTIKNVESLRRITERVLDAIIEHPEKLPFAMRYMANVLRKTLHEKFPNAAEKDILKVVGNLVYYRYINCALIGPDAYNIIHTSGGLQPNQRKNLGAVAKMLQLIASNKGFGDHMPHLTPLNSYIIQAHVAFKKYLLEVCNVETLEQHYEIDEFTDMTLLSKPVIYITAKELVDMHQLLLKYESQITYGSDDPLHEILEELGDDPNLDDFGKSELTLTLGTKNVEIAIIDDKTLFVNTKRLLVDVLHCCQPADSLRLLLDKSATDEEENCHSLLTAKREKLDRDAERRGGILVRQKSFINDSHLPLQSIKTKVLTNLKELEKNHLVKSFDDYQSIISSIANDIRSQRTYRIKRKSEMSRLKNTLERLSTKRGFCEEQVNFYTQYVKTCLDKQGTIRRKHKRLLLRPSKRNQVIKYSAKQLHEKGVIIEIEGLPQNQMKNVMFEIKESKDAGVFDVGAKFMGVDMDKVQITFDDLLQLQYEGVAKMNMFDKALVNVNLLIFLLNKKFYGK